MQTGAITSYVDVAQISLYVFWAFFAGLIYYLHREDKREGYPLESERTGHVKVQGFPAMPGPKTFLLPHGGTTTAPKPGDSARPLAAEPIGRWLGAPLEPTGNPMLDAVGPAAYAQRSDTVDLTFEGIARIVPLRVADGFDVSRKDPDPRGKTVYGADGVAGGVVKDLWVDRSEMVFRYLEVEVSSAGVSRSVLLPINFTRISASKIKVRSIMGRHFAQVPGTKDPVAVTLLEEDRIMAYYGGGTLYAEPSRQEPLL